MNVTTLKNEIQLELELNALAQPAVDAARNANAAAGAASSAAARANTAAINAEAAVEAANDAAASATSAATDAREQAGEAEEAAAKASEAEAEANAAAESANAEAEAASKAASAANAAAESIQSVLDGKADAIMDTSERAASHSLHAQDGPLAVTLYGKTTETGTGDKSPDNPYTISGVDAVQVHAGGKNLWNPDLFAWRTTAGLTFSKGNNGEIVVNGTSTSMAYLNFGNFYMPPDIVRISVYGDSNIGALFQAQLYDQNDSRIGTENRNINTEKSAISKSGADCAYIKGYLQIPSGVTVSNHRIFVQAELGTTTTDYEPYNANVITPALLPDGAPLHGNGTVDDTIENDVLIDGERKCRVRRKWKTTHPASTNNWAQVADGEARFYCAELVAGTGHPIACEGFECYQTYNEWYSAYKAGKFAMCIASSVLYVSAPGYTTLDAFKAWWATIEPVTVWYTDGSEQTYVTDPLPLRKPDTLESDTVTVTGSAETAVDYPCDTKTYIDRKFDALAAALLS